MSLIHATCVAFREGGAVLLLGPCGAGKSDLALRLIDRGAELVADDQVRLRCEAGGLYASAPETIAGLIELRGVGIVKMPFRASAQIRLATELVGASEVERMPQKQSRLLEGVTIPLLRLFPFEASAPLKVEWSLKSFPL